MDNTFTIDPLNMALAIENEEDRQLAIQGLNAVYALATDIAIFPDIVRQGPLTDSEIYGLSILRRLIKSLQS